MSRKKIAGAASLLSLLLVVVMAVGAAASGCYHEKPKPTVGVELRCVPNSNGVRTRLEMTTVFNTDGPELTLVRHLEVNGVNRPIADVEVQGEGSVDLFRHLGRGTFQVTGYVQLGKEKFSFGESIRCAREIVRDPEGYIIGPCGDPMAGAVMDNRGSNVTVKYKLMVGDRAVIVRHVGAGKEVVTKAIYVKPGVEVKLYANGKLIDRAVFKGGNFGWKKNGCELLR